MNPLPSQRKSTSSAMGFFSNLRRSKSDARSNHTLQGSQAPFPVRASTYPAPRRSVLRRTDRRLISKQNRSSASLPSPASDFSLPPEYTDLDVDTSRYPNISRSHISHGSQISRTHRGRKDVPEPIVPYPLHNLSRVPVLTSVLAVGSVSLIWDVREPPMHMRQPRDSRQVKDLSVPATSTRPQRLCLISYEFPWSIDVAAKKNRPLTALDVVEALYEALDREVRRSEWALAPESNKYAMQRANRIRRQAETAKRIRRVDWLGSRCMFRGLEKDDNLARKRLMPGDRTDCETWVVRFGSHS